MKLKCNIEDISSKDNYFIVHFSIHEKLLKLLDGNLLGYQFEGIQQKEFVSLNSMDEVIEKLYEYCNIYFEKFVVYDIIGLQKLKNNIAFQSKRGVANIEIFDNIWVYSGYAFYDKLISITKKDEKYNLYLNPNFGILGFIYEEEI